MLSITVDWNYFIAEGDDDEDDLDGAGGKDRDEMFKQMGSGASAHHLNDLDDEDTNSDDESMPDFENVPKTNDEKN
ncbi:unnamed protein product [Rotaria sordida]|uniref:Uncharacterized protein n=1 Tax=Rotaria sordida TaxID=392033 RepID=A0A819KCU7_9BILA|nr:unnamed protein product [Rotaria sordida]